MKMVNLIIFNAKIVKKMVLVKKNSFLETVFTMQHVNKKLISKAMSYNTIAQKKMKKKQL